MIAGETIELYRTTTQGYSISVLHEARPGGPAAGIIYLILNNDRERSVLWGYTELLTASLIEDQLDRLLGPSRHINDSDIQRIAAEIDARIIAEKALRTPEQDS